MSEMSEKAPPQPAERRKQIIKKNIAAYTIAQIAKNCGVNERTIYRDIDEMKESGEWSEWIEVEYIRLHREGDIKDSQKYHEMALLYGKSKTQKIEAKIEQKVEVEKPVITVKDLIGEYGDVILDEVMRRHLQGDRGDNGQDPAKPVDSPPPDK